MRGKKFMGREHSSELSCSESEMALFCPYVLVQPEMETRRFPFVQIPSRWRVFSGHRVYRAMFLSGVSKKRERNNLPRC
jgi:hypothetical protein